MKPRLIILSDLWGKRKSKWIKSYNKILNENFNVIFYDCCELGMIDISVYHQDDLHNQFINSGIEIATNRLLVLEKEKIDILAFSIGGVIAWRAGLHGLQIKNFYAISSTRLRYEIKKPNGNLKVYFGSKDKYKPEPAWYDYLKISPCIVSNKDHEMYKEADIAIEICNEIHNISC